MTARFGIEMAIGVLACVGLWVTVDKTAAGILRAWEWARRDRVTPLLEDDEIYCYPECPPGCDCSRLELPPEQSAEALGFTGEQPAWRVRPCPDPETHPHEPGILYTHDRRPTFLERLEARRERLASAAELEHRAAYEAMGFDYPSGLMARVRETAL